METTEKYERLADVWKELEVSWIRPQIETPKLQELNLSQMRLGGFRL